jgi:hypothetical protein
MSGMELGERSRPVGPLVLLLSVLGEAILTPRPITPMMTMVMMSTIVPFNHCPKVGLRFKLSWPYVARSWVVGGAG